jgi:thiol-disulfide isomerase/thioredoxin
MDQYLDKLTAKHPDSINVSADVLVEKSRANGEIFQYVVSYITSTYERSKIMGMDAVFVHMVENYYITKQCDWVDSTQLVKIADRAQKIAPNLIGREASEFVDFYGRPFMKDTSGITHTLQEINADYTVLVFFGPTCGHCKKEMPKIKHDVDSLVTAGIDIKTFAVATEFDKKEWKKFINTQKTGDWLNVADINHDEEGNPVASSDWRDKYDIYSTPVIYLLDKDKKIIAKRITHTQIVEIIGRLEER